MNRKEFVKVCGILGVGLPFSSAFASCKKESALNNSGKVIVIGAGAGGMSSAYLLSQLGVDVQILEASSTYGGRMKTTNDFVDFPIPLGSEWIHTKKNVFQDMVNDSAIQTNVQTASYNPQEDTEAYWQNNELTIRSLGGPDRKFDNYSWLDFYRDYILPSIQDKIVFNSPVQSIDYSRDQVVVTTTSQTYTADKVILSVPLKILQLGLIDIYPKLPQDKTDAINNTKVWDGFKAFIEFSEKFYDTVIVFPYVPETRGQKLYYDAAFGQSASNRHVLGLFSVGEPAREFQALSDSELKDFMLQELDTIYSNQATPKYIKHISQNWNDEPYIQGAYMSDYTPWRSVRTLGKSVEDKLYFAGGEYTNGSNWVAVHAAAQSAKDAVKSIIS